MATEISITNYFSSERNRFSRLRSKCLGTALFYVIVLHNVMKTLPGIKRVIKTKKHHLAIARQDTEPISSGAAPGRTCGGALGSRIRLDVFLIEEYLNHRSALPWTVRKDERISRSKCTITHTVSRERGRLRTGECNMGNRREIQLKEGNGVSYNIQYSSTRGNHEQQYCNTLRSSLKRALCAAANRPRVI